MEVSVTVGALILVMRQSTAFSVDERKLVHDLFDPPAEPSTAASSKYARSALDQPTRTRIQSKLRHAMNDLQLFRDSRLTLRDLCERINENPHYVSQVINQDLHSNFYDFVNGHRIESAKQALAGASETTVLEVALDAGFNSKSTFNAAFRRYVGMTPTEYRQSGSYPDGSDARTT
jgi:AraC-like DNA-binding protein